MRLGFFFYKWNSIRRKARQKKIKLTSRSTNRRDCFIIIQNSLCILNTTHSEVNIPLPYSQYSNFQFVFSSRTGLPSLNFSTVVLCSSQRGCNTTFKHATGYRLHLRNIRYGDTPRTGRPKKMGLILGRKNTIFFFSKSSIPVLYYK
jgi:hypothetical protein